MAVYLSVKNTRYEFHPIKGKAENRTLNSELTRVKNLQILVDFDEILWEDGNVPYCQEYEL
jgi:hypothetical protein